MSIVQKAFDGVSQAFFKEDHDYFRKMISDGDADKIGRYLKKFPHAAQWKFGPHEYTTIHEAAMGRHLDLIPLFQSHGVDINQPTVGGEPPVRWAHNKDDIGKMVAMGATMDDPRWKGLTPLMYAAQFAWSDQVEGLLEHGADPHKVYNGTYDLYKGKTALQLASRFTDDMGEDDRPCMSQARTVELLLAKGGHSIEELQICNVLARGGIESMQAAKWLHVTLHQALADKAAAEIKAIEVCVNGLPESTTVRRPIVFRKP